VPDDDDAPDRPLQSFSVAATNRHKSCIMATPAAAGDDMPRAIAPHWFTFVAALLLVTGLSSARATEPVSAVDTKAVRAVVEAQLDAFAADDAKKAFSLAAPSIRAMFETPEKFVAMVRAGYPVVYRPASVTFLQPLWVQRQLVLGVRRNPALCLSRTARSSSRRSTGSPKVRGMTCRCPRACSAASSRGKASGAAPKRSSSSGTSSRAGS